jgi:hypothetical protein
MPIILAMWEAEIRIAIPGQPGKTVSDTPSQPIAGHIPTIPSYMGG